MLLTAVQPGSADVYRRPGCAAILARFIRRRAVAPECQDKQSPQTET